MNSPFFRSIRIRSHLLILAILLVSILITGLWFWQSEDSTKQSAILSGLCTGFIIALVEFIFQWNSHREIQLIKELGIERIMAHRDDRSYYERLISTSQNQIWVLGNTASRFLDDFANETRNDCRQLLQALARNVEVRILVPQLPFLHQSKDGPRLELALKRMKEVRKQYPGLFLCREFAHSPNHSIVRVDGNCLVGPIFPEVNSKDSPVVHAHFSSPLVTEYLKYFEAEWDAAHDI